MSLYGNVKKIGSASFQFDRKYPNRVEMDANAERDGVYAGRYVLVEYGYRFGKDDEDITSVNTGTAISEFPDGYKLINTEDGAVRVEGVQENQAFKTNAETDLRAYGAVYDSTVWQKIYVSGKDKYVMVAELNALAPKLDITQDTPLTYKVTENDIENYRTRGIVTGKINERGELVETVRLTNTEEIYNKAYFDTALDTELTYLMHLPTTLNLEIDSETVDFNENGFNIAYSYPEDEGVSTIAWIPKGHDDNGDVVYLDNYMKRGDGNTDNGGNEFATLQGGPYPMDTKMLFMSFPALGNAMNALYNLLYGKPDPEDDLTHGAMRPYFKRFLDNIVMKNIAIVKDRNGEPIEITDTDPYGFTNYVYIEGPVGNTIEAILNEADALRINDLQPSEYVEVRFRDDTTDPPIYYRLDDEGYVYEHPGAYVLWDKLRGQPILMTIHVPTGDEDPDLEWLKNIPALADILANNTTGLATVLSNLFGDSDPLTGTTKYYLYNDWTMTTDENTSGPAIINKPKVVGGYEELILSVPANAEKYNLAGQQIYETPGYFWNFNLDNQGETIEYPHSEITVSNIFSEGDFKVDYSVWQLVNYSTPDIVAKINKCLFNSNIQDLNETQQNNVTIHQESKVITITSENNLISYNNSENIAGKWVGLDIDTGFKSIIKISIDDYRYTPEDEETFRTYGLEEGHILYMVNLDEPPVFITLKASGFNDTIYKIDYHLA